MKYIEAIDELNKFSDYLQNNFDIDEPVRLYVNTVVNSYTKFYNDIYSVTFIDKSNSNIKYKLIFMIYDLCVFDNHEFYENDETDSEYVNDIHTNFLDSGIKFYKKGEKCLYRTKYIPLYFSDHNTIINMYGLCNNYYDLGNYICKVLDYESHAYIKEHQLYTIRNSDYIYIGDKYNDLFPFNVIKNKYSHIEFIHKHTGENYTGPLSIITDSIKHHFINHVTQFLYTGHNNLYTSEELYNMPLDINKYTEIIVAVKEADTSMDVDNELIENLPPPPLIRVRR